MHWLYDIIIATKTDAHMHKDADTLVAQQRTKYANGGHKNKY